VTLKSLLLQLLSALPTDEPALEVALLVRAAALFGFEAGAVRVTLSRLVAAGHVESAGRGRWRLTATAAGLADQVATWRGLERRVRPWSGGWIGVATGGLGRTDRAAVRRRERALSMFGFRELRPGLQIRPDNRAEPLPVLRSALERVGLEADAPVFAMSDLGPEQPHAVALWDGARLAAGYRAHREAIVAVRAAVATVPVELAAREVFVTGSAVLKLLAFDPLLPDAIVDPAPRRALVEAMAAFDAEGRVVWRRVLLGPIADASAGREARA
jgi:phenylacetic acid degradation operon negative regulatory protein